MFEYRDEFGTVETLMASSIKEALDLAEEFTRGGDWGSEGAAVRVWVIERSEDGEEIDRAVLTVEIEPDHAALIRRAVRDCRERSCGDDPEDHDWTSEGEGGCDQNPGVWSAGGTAMVFASHCRDCGLRRSEYHCGSQRNPGQHDRVEYTMPARPAEDDDETPGRWCVRNGSGLYLNSLGAWTVDWDLAARFSTAEEAERRAADCGGAIEEWRDRSED